MPEGTRAAVDDSEAEAEPRLHLLLPLDEHTRRSRDDAGLGATAQQQLAQDQPGLDRLAQAHVVGDELVYARHQQRLAQRFELVVEEANAGTERRLEQGRIGGGDATPAQGAVEGAEAVRRIELGRSHALPARGGDDLGVRLDIPQDGQRGPDCVVIDAGECHEPQVLGGGCAYDGLDEPTSVTYARKGPDHRLGPLETLEKLEPDPGELLRLLERWRAEAVKAGRTIERVALAYEAGRDGFWLARWLQARGIEAHVIHSTSVAVSREHRRAKTGRLDTAMLMRVFLGWPRCRRMLATSVWAAGSVNWSNLRCSVAAVVSA